MIPLNQAVRASPTLSGIAQRIEQSQRMLEAISPLLPAPLRAHVIAGPLDTDRWCILVSNPAVASKMRQLSPSLLAALRSAGFSLEHVRIKVRSG